MAKRPTKKEIREHMEAYNNDEIGLENPIDMEQSEVILLNSDEYYYANKSTSV